MLHVNWVGTLTATLLAALRQVWIAQAKLPEDCKKTLRDLPIVLGHLFGPNVSELLDKIMKLSEMTRQLTQTHRGPVFKVLPTQVRRRMAMAEQRFHQRSTPKYPGPQRPRVAENTQGFRLHQRKVPGGPRRCPPVAAKGRTHKALSGWASSRSFFKCTPAVLETDNSRSLGLDYFEQGSYPAVSMLATKVLKDYSQSNRGCSSFNGSLIGNLFSVGEGSNRKSSPPCSKGRVLFNLPHGSQKG